MSRVGLGSRLVPGQGREKVRALLEENAELREAIEAKVKEYLGMHPQEFIPTPEDLAEGEDGEDLPPPAYEEDV